MSCITGTSFSETFPSAIPVRGDRSSSGLHTRSSHAVLCKISHHQKRIPLETERSGDELSYRILRLKSPLFSSWFLKPWSSSVGPHFFIPPTLFTRFPHSCAHPRFMCLRVSLIVLLSLSLVTEISFVKTAQVVKINAQLADDWGDFLYSPSSAGVTSWSVLCFVFSPSLL